jgi:hypothetical protein
MDADLAYHQKMEDLGIENQAKVKHQLSKQQKRVLEELRTGAKNTGHFCRLDKPILRVSERVRELNEMGYFIVNINVNENGNPKGLATYKLSENKV